MDIDHPHSYGYHHQEVPSFMPCTLTLFLQHCLIVAVLTRGPSISIRSVWFHRGDEFHHFWFYTSIPINSLVKLSPMFVAIRLYQHIIFRKKKKNNNYLLVNVPVCVDFFVHLRLCLKIWCPQILMDTDRPVCAGKNTTTLWNVSYGQSANRDVINRDIMCWMRIGGVPACTKWSIAITPIN